MSTVTVHDKAGTGANVDRLDVEAVNKKEARSLYAARKKIHPKRASGSFRQLKWWIMAVTLAVYYVTPWLRWNRGEYAPDQAVLVDMANRRFYFFFIEIWPQEFYYVAGLLIMAGIGLFLVTSTIGRAWCGYTCPQTVWVDLFLVVERAVEGERNNRIKLDEAPWSRSKITKRVVKHAIWLLIAIATGGAWIFYFADAPSLFVDFFALQAPAIAYVTVAILTATTYVFGGHMREQVCTYMCPWPRIQSAMLDEESLTVTYKSHRGEPRARHQKRVAETGAAVGDCIDCNQCVAVCPMGIDIRDGQQMECITCALCIDACDGVMTKIGKPRGLIDYATLADVEAEVQGRATKSIWRSLIRPRTLIYLAIWSAIGLIMLGLLLTRDRLDVTVQQDRNPLFVTLSDGSVRNGYTLKISNMLPAPRYFTVELDGMPSAVMHTAGQDSEPGRSMRVQVDADKLLAIKLYVTHPANGLAAAGQQFAFHVQEVFGAESASYDAVFHSQGSGN